MEEKSKADTLTILQNGNKVIKIRVKQNKNAGNMKIQCYKSAPKVAINDIQNVSTTKDYNLS